MRPADIKQVALDTWPFVSTIRCLPPVWSTSFDGKLVLPLKSITATWPSPKVRDCPPTLTGESARAKVNQIAGDLLTRAEHEVGGCRGLTSPANASGHQGSAYKRENRFIFILLLQMAAQWCKDAAKR